MDYTLAALKLLCQQLKTAKETSSQSAMVYGHILFQRAWLQGVLVSLVEENEQGRLLLDDGTGVIHLSLSTDFRQRNWATGMYVMVIGAYFVRNGEPPMIKVKSLSLSLSPRKLMFSFQVHKMVDLSAFPDREAMWYLEVIEAHQLFYAEKEDEE
ncbi:RecQ-mediated genome instability protein 2 [Dillenia turbinata]|uniref:RecQ-mediated genome instability protein 2 n=1 Tax=Dillenia turbinata TaxID=194707 RepID=A0AAN8VJE6_9MAGN